MLRVSHRNIDYLVSVFRARDRVVNCTHGRKKESKKHPQVEKSRRK